MIRSKATSMLFVFSFITLNIAYANELSPCLNIFEEGKYEKGFKCLMLLAQNGNAEAQYYVSGAYEHGIGVESNVPKMWEWLTSSSKKGFPDAQYKIFYHYRFTGYTPEWENRDKAIAWLEKAVLSGSPYAHHAKAVFLENRTPNEKPLIESHYKKALDGLLKQDQNVFNLERIYLLISICRRFHDESVDEKKKEDYQIEKWLKFGKSYFDKHEKHGHSSVLYDKALSYLNPDLEYYNCDLGISMLEDATLNGSLGATSELIAGFRTGHFNRCYSPENIDLNLSFNVASLGSKRGIAPAMYWLGKKYSEGEGVPQNIEKAIYWLRKAYDGGFKMAEYSLKKIQNNANSADAKNSAAD